MKIFQSIQKSFAILGIRSNQDRFNGRMLSATIVFGFGNIISVITLFTGTETFREYSDAIYVTCAAIVFVICLANLILKMKNLFEIIDCLEMLVDKRSEHPESKPIYDEVNRQVEKCSEIAYFVMVKLTPVCLILPQFCVGMFVYFTTDLGYDAFKVPSPMWSAWNKMDPIEYTIASIVQFIYDVYCFALITGMLSFSIGAYLYAIALTRDMKFNLMQLKKNAKAKRNRMQTHKQFGDFVELHSAFKQLISDFSDIYQLMLAAFIGVSIVQVCAAMLMIQVEISHPEIVLTGLSLPIVYGCYSASLVFIACELGYQTSNLFSELSDVAQQWSWYLLPNEINRTLPTILIVLQELVPIKCFGSISCDRENFKRITNTIFSYFMTLRQFRN